MMQYAHYNDNVLLVALAWLKYATSKACPKPDNMILKYLKEHKGLKEKVYRSQERVCITCYNSQQIVLQKCLAYKQANF